MTIKLREYIVTLVLFSLSTSSKPEPEPELLGAQGVGSTVDCSYWLLVTEVLAQALKKYVPLATVGISFIN